MGSYDSAEVLDLYRDDGLGATSLPGTGVESLKKKVIQHFKSIGLSITTEVNIKTINFLDLNLEQRN